MKKDSAERKLLLAHAQEAYGAQPEYLFEKYPDFAVLRNPGSGKWFAIFMKVDAQRLGLEGEGQVELVNVKCAPDDVVTLRMAPGILPAYHMNKKHWVSLVLDTVPEALQLDLLSTSFDLTK